MNQHERTNETAMAAWQRLDPAERRRRLNEAHKKMTQNPALYNLDTPMVCPHGQGVAGGTSGAPSERR